MSDHTLITGFPAFLAQCLARRLLETDPQERVVLLCPGRFQVVAQVFLRELSPQARERVEVLVGDASDMDLGLPAPDFRRLCEELTAIVHLAGPAPVLPAGPPPGGSAPSSAPARSRARSGAKEHPILAAARHVIDLGCDCARLRRLCHVSSTAVSAGRTGVVLEEDQVPGRAADPRDEALLRAEGLVAQAMHSRRLPAMVLRPAPLVGDSRTGEIDSFGGPYALLQAVLASPVDLGQLLPAQGWGSAPLHMVPVDFVTEAAVLLLRDARAAGLTFHLTDPCPLPLYAVGEMVARLSERKALRAPTVPPRLLRAVLRAPGLDRLARAPVASLDSLGTLVFYNCQNTLRLLEGTGLRCPPVASYLDRLVSFLQQAQQAQQAHQGRQDDDVSDPLA